MAVALIARDGGTRAASSRSRCGTFNHALLLLPSSFYATAFPLELYFIASHFLSAIHWPARLYGGPEILRATRSVAKGFFFLFLFLFGRRNLSEMGGKTTIKIDAFIADGLVDEVFALRWKHCALRGNGTLRRPEASILWRKNPRHIRAWTATIGCAECIDNIICRMTLILIICSSAALIPCHSFPIDWHLC